MSKLVPLMLLVAGAIIATLLYTNRSAPDPQCAIDFRQSAIQVGDTTLSIGLAASPDEQTKGLGGCQLVPDQSGLLFPYNPPRSTAFWMRGMVIPIDIIWIGDGRVTGIEEAVPPPADPASINIPTYPSPGAISGVLEIKSGGAKEYGIEVGDLVNFDE